MTVIAPQAPTIALGRLPRQFVRYAVVGVANTGLFLALYLVLRLVLSATAANLLATLLTTVAGTTANGRVTFGVPVRPHQHVKSIAITGLSLAISTAAVNLAGLGTLGELAVLVAAGIVTGAMRFVLLRHWVFTARG